MEQALKEILQHLEQYKTSGVVVPLSSVTPEELLALRSMPGFVSALLDGWLRRIGENQMNDGRYAPLATHLADPKFSQAYPLHLQEYSHFVAKEPRLEAPMWEVMNGVTWPKAYAEALAHQEEEAIAKTASTLLSYLDEIVEEALLLVAQIEQLKALKDKHQLTMVQAEACFVATTMRDATAFADTQIIDLGCAEGSIIGYFQSLGAIASGLEIDEAWDKDVVLNAEDTTKIQQDNFMSLPKERQFDLITGTGFFESGAFIWPDKGEQDIARFLEERDILLEQVAQSLAPGGLLVIRNFTEPIIFRQEAIARAGLTYHHVLAPTAASQYSGRAACFLKQPSTG